MADVHPSSPIRPPTTVASACISSKPSEPTKKTEERKRRETYGKSASAPSAPATNLANIGQNGGSRLEAKGHKDDAVMGQRTHGRQHGALLPTAKRRRAHKDAGVFAPVAALHPLPTGMVPEDLPLGGEVAVAGRDAEQEGVELGQHLGGDVGDVIVFSVFLLGA